MKIKILCQYSQLCHILFIASRMGTNEIGDNLLFQSCFIVYAVEYLLEFIELVERRFAHKAQYIVLSMFWSNLQSSTYVVFYQFTCIFTCRSIGFFIFSFM